MTNRQKLELRQSEIRERLGEISGLTGDKLTDEIKAERDKLQTEYRDNEPQLRAAIVADESAGPIETRTDGEGVEFRALQSRVSVGAFLESAVAGVAPDGAEAELRAAVGLDEQAPNLVPWAAFAPRYARQTDQGEARADAPTTIAIATDAQANQGGILGRVFNDSAGMFMGFDYDMVEVGDAVCPVLTGGPTPEAAALGTKTEAEAAAFNVETLNPREMRARILFARRDAMRFVGLEDALRADLAGAISEQLDKLIITGTGASNQPTGLLQKLADPTAPDAETTWNGYVKIVAGGVDGRYARDLSEVRALVGVETYAAASATLGSNNPGPGAPAMTAADYLRGHSGGFMASPHFAAAASSIQQGLIYKAGRGMGSGKAVLWEGVEIIRDHYGDDGAASGRVALTAVVNYNLAVLRSEAYKQVAYHVGS